MSNPWEDIDLNSYENHMSLGSVFQLQTMNKMMKDQFYAYPVQSVMILGVAGGNGLEQIGYRKIVQTDEDLPNGKKWEEIGQNRLYILPAGLYGSEE